MQEAVARLRVDPEVVEPRAARLAPKLPKAELEAELARQRAEEPRARVARKAALPAVAAVDGVGPRLSPMMIWAAEHGSSLAATLPSS